MRRVPKMELERTTNLVSRISAPQRVNCYSCSRTPCRERIRETRHRRLLHRRSDTVAPRGVRRLFPNSPADSLGVRGDGACGSFAAAVGHRPRRRETASAVRPRKFRSAQKSRVPIFHERSRGFDPLTSEEQGPREGQTLSHSPTRSISQVLAHQQDRVRTTPVLKTGDLARGPGVRIPHPPCPARRRRSPSRSRAERIGRPGEPRGSIGFRPFWPVAPERSDWTWSKRSRRDEMLLGCTLGPLAPGCGPAVPVRGLPEGVRAPERT